MATAKMTMSTFLIFFFVGSALSSTRIPQGSVDNFEAPLIMTSRDEIVLEVGKTLNLTCRDTQKVVWLAFQHDLMFDSYTESFDEGHVRPYITNLVMENVNYTNVGYYFCVHNTTENKNKTEWSPSDANVSSVYVYVKDLDHLLAKESEQMVYQPEIGKNFTFPCKPTFPEVQVILEKVQGDFDPRYGFTSNVSEDLDIVTCYAYYDDLEVEKDFLITFIDTSRTELLSMPSVFVTNFWAKNAIVDHEKGLQYYDVEEGSAFNLTCEYDHDRSGTMKSLVWERPRSATNDSGNFLIYRDINVGDTITRILMVHNANVIRDSGEYRCYVTNNVADSHPTAVFINVFPSTYANVSLIMEEQEMELGPADEEFTWRVIYAGFPSPNFIWRRGDEVLANYTNPKQGSNRYKMEKDIYQDGNLFLTLKSPSIDDIDIHTLEAVITDNGKILARDYVQWNVTMPVSPFTPTLEFFINNVTYDSRMLPPNQDFHLKCKSQGYPKPKMNLEFSQCYSKDNCTDFQKLTSRESLISMKESALNQYNEGITNITSVWEGKTTTQGRFRCSARNRHVLGAVPYVTKDLLITDGGNKPLGLEVIINGYRHRAVEANSGEKLVRVLEADDIAVLCRGNKLGTSQPLTWMMNGYPFDASNYSSNPTFTCKQNDTEFSYISIIEIGKISLEEEHLNFSCESPDTSGLRADLQITVEPMRPPSWLTPENPLQDKHLKEMGNLTLSCPASGAPEPEIKWYKNDKPLQDSDETDKKHRIIKGSVINFSYLKISDSGVYKCKAVNRNGTISSSATISVTDPDAFAHSHTIIIVSILSSILIFLSIILCIKIYKDRKRAYSLCLEDQRIFEQGDPENLNPELGLEEQADLLPYDNKYEVSRDSIIFDKLLGAGAFGRVYRAKAMNLIPGQAHTTVAVKMMKSRTDNAQLKALRSEVKIMIHIGRHVNIVNLLGACSKELATKGELLLLVEYCKHGNILDYMRHHRKDFINQINDYDKIDGSLTETRLRIRSESGSRMSRGLKYAHLSFNQDRVAYSGRSTHDDSSLQTVWVDASSPTESFGGTNGHISEVFRNRTLSGSSAPHVASDMSSMTFESSNGGSDTYIGSRVVGSSPPNLCSKDLLCWAFQIARGMEYLAFKKVMHGDLAARNILLTEDHVVKISDFGLAKDIYKNDNYRKKSKAPVPWKWLAVECFRDGVFSTQSDIWSFGIVLWEIFSLGQSPYPGVEFDESFILKLEKGVRPEQPKFATYELYRVMYECWASEPMERPSFSVLESKLGAMLGEAEKEHYLSLDTPYQFENTASTFVNDLQSPDYTAKIKDRNLAVDQDGYEMPFSPSPYGASAMMHGQEFIRNSHLTPLNIYMHNGDAPDGHPLGETGASYVPMSSPTRVSTSSRMSQNVFSFEKEALDSLSQRDSEIMSYARSPSIDQDMREDSYLSMQNTPTSEKSPSLILENSVPLRHKLVRTASQMDKHDSGLYSPTANLQINPHYMMMGNFPKTDENNYLTKDECDSYSDNKPSYININEEKVQFKTFKKDYISDAKCNAEYSNLLPNGISRGRTISEASSGLGSISEESPPEYRSKPESLNLKSPIITTVMEEPLCV